MSLNKFHKLVLKALIIMRTEKNCRQKAFINKRDHQSISKLNYYLYSLFPSIFETSLYPTKQQCFLKTNYIENTYNYIHKFSIGPESLSEGTFIQLIKPIYFQGNIVNFGQNSYIREIQIKSSILPIKKRLRQNIVIFTLRQSDEKQENQKYVVKSPSKLNFDNSNKFSLSKQKSVPAFITQKQSSSKNYSLYIIHHCIPSEQDSQLRWQNFIQSYRVSFQQTKGSVKSIIRYQVIFSYHYKSLVSLLEKYMNYLQLYFQQTIFSSFQKKSLKYFEKIAEKLKVFNQAKRIKDMQNHKNPSFDEIHRRQLLLSPQHIKLFSSLKIKTFAYYSSINRQKDINRFFLQNLTCRMMQNNNYKSEQSWQAIKYYIDFQKRMRKKYRWTDFQKYQKMNIFMYIGKDMMGRPVIFNILRNVLCSKIENFDQFFDYHFYLFEIFMQDQMEGWVDQFIFLADASNQISDNTNLGFTKKLVNQILKLTLGRAYKVVVYDVNLLGKAIFRILKPFMPDKFFETLKIIGDDKEQLLYQLRLYLPDNVIPISIGGKNKIHLDNSKEEKAQTDFTIFTQKKVTNLKKIQI